MGSLQLHVPRVFVPLLQPARYKGVHGGRGSGKSHFFGEQLLVRCVRQPTRAVCVREVQKSLDQSVKRLLEDKIKSLNLSGFRVQTNQIRAPHDGLITFQGMQDHTADSIKSLEGFDIGWVEEAQSLSQTSMDLLRPTIRKEGSELWFSWNPRHKTDPVDALLRGDSLPPGAVVVQANYRDNPWFPEVLRLEMEWDRQRDPEKYAHIWLGAYEQLSEARVFKNWRVEAFETPADAVFNFGGDWGFSTDPSVLVRNFLTAQRARTVYIDAEVYQIGCEIDDTPALFDALGCEICRVPAVKAPGAGVDCQGRGRGHAMARRWRAIVDSNRPDTISYMQRHGYPRLEPAVKGPGSLEEGITFLQSYDLVVHPRCTHAIDELTFYRYKTDKLTGAVIPVLEDKKNHVIDSLRYSVEPLRRAKGGSGQMRQPAQHTPALNSLSGRRPSIAGGVFGRRPGAR